MRIKGKGKAGAGKRTQLRGSKSRAGATPGTKGSNAEIEDQLAREQEEVLEELRLQAHDKIPTALHDYLSGFACFGENDCFGFPADHGVKPDKKKVTKAKKKMADKSKRKNRT